MSSSRPPTRAAGAASAGSTSAAGATTSWSRSSRGRSARSAAGGRPAWPPARWPRPRTRSSRRLLEGGPLPRLRDRLAHLAESLRYEEAARLRDRIDALEQVVERLARLEGLRELRACLVAPAAEPGWRNGFFVAGGVVRSVRPLPPGTGALLELEAGLAACRAAEQSRRAVERRAGRGPAAARRLHPPPASGAGRAAPRTRPDRGASGRDGSVLDSPNELPELRPRAAGNLPVLPVLRRGGDRSRRRTAPGGAQGRERALRRPRRLHGARRDDGSRGCRGLLAPYHAQLRAELERFGGTVEKFIGDAVMALFGAPVAHEDDPERAVRAALAIRDWVGEQGDELQVRVAVNTGEALVALGARPSEGEGMAAGDVVNTAARLQIGRAGERRSSSASRPTARPRRRSSTARPSRSPARERASRSRPGRRAGALELRGRRRAARARAARRARTRARATRLDARPGSRGALAPARHPRRRPGHRQEPARARALRRRRARTPSWCAGARAARCRTARASPSGRSPRSSRRRPGSSRTTRPRRPRRSCDARSREVGDEAERPWVERHLRPLVGLRRGGRPASAGGGLRRLAPVPRGACRASARSCSSSKTSTGPTTACSTSSTTSSSGRAGCRCSSSAPRGRSCSSDARAGAEGSRTR